MKRLRESKVFEIQPEGKSNVAKKDTKKDASKKRISSKTPTHADMFTAKK